MEDLRWVMAALELADVEAGTRVMRSREFVQGEKWGGIEEGAQVVMVLEASEQVSLVDRRVV
ncbi:MAG: hypothetical protein HY861_02175 [Chlamydiia bacterium]|nr:hypothetical protein [Chlamydiia bacterium]